MQVRPKSDQTLLRYNHADNRAVCPNLHKHCIQEVRHHATSGTSAKPNSVPAPMLTSMKGNWMLMFHGNVFAVDTQQSRPRGGDKFFSTNWFMPMAQRSLGPGQLTIRSMFSLEPPTVAGQLPAARPGACETPSPESRENAAGACLTSLLLRVFSHLLVQLRKFL